MKRKIVIGVNAFKKDREEAAHIEGDALQQLYKEYHGAIYLYLYAMCHDAALAEDLTQDTFVKALLSLPEGHTNVRAWLYMVARNLYFNNRKREKKSVPWDEMQFREDASGDSLLAKVVWSEKRAVLFRGINQLSPTKREVLQLQYFSGLPQKEIAGILGLTPANVRVLALRARRDLKCYLEENGYDFS